MAKSSRHFVALDSLRGLCALMIVFFHFPSTGWLGASAFIEHSNLFVDFFFVLSGFVIAANYLDRIPDTTAAARFMWLRIGRLYPLHLFILLGFVIFEVAEAAIAIQSTGQIGDAFSGQMRWQTLITSALLIHSWGIHDSLVWNWPSWSISCELAAYGLFAAIVVFARRWRDLIFAVAIFGSIFVLAFLTTGYFLETYDYGLFRCFAGFFMGVFVWKAWHKWESHQTVNRLTVTGWTVLEGMAALCVIVFVTFASFDAITFAAPIVFGMAVLIFANDKGMVSAVLKYEPFPTLGLLSYSVYMVHIFLLQRFANGVLALERLTGIRLETDTPSGEIAYKIPGLPPDILAVCFALGVVVVSWFTYHWVEVVWRDWFRAHIPMALKKRQEVTL